VSFTEYIYSEVGTPEIVFIEVIISEKWHKLEWRMMGFYEYKMSNL